MYIFGLSLILVAYMAMTRMSKIEEEVYILEVDSTHVFPRIDEYGHAHFNIPQLVLSEFTDPYQAFININMVALSILIHRWMDVIQDIEALERLCRLYSIYPIDCSVKNYEQYNYTHCRSGAYLYRPLKYSSCPVESFILSLNHNGQNLAWGADVIYKEFVTMI